MAYQVDRNIVGTSSLSAHSVLIPSCSQSKPHKLSLQQWFTNPALLKILGKYRYTCLILVLYLWTDLFHSYSHNYPPVVCDKTSTIHTSKYHLSMINLYICHSHLIPSIQFFVLGELHVNLIPFKTWSNTSKWTNYFLHLLAIFKYEPLKVQVEA